jgi:predicted enzyme related to lactoylglutathione lyase
MSARFCRYELRTTDVSAAQAFYRAVLGGEDRVITELPAAAAARGAPAHWLGTLGPVDVEETASRWIAQGGMRLGPASAERAIVRDPNGATVALARGGAIASAGVVWHLLHAANVPRAVATYVAPFGWCETERVALPPPFGAQRTFAIVAGEEASAAITDITDRPTVHEHWLFFFDAPDFDEKLARVRDRGGEVFAIVETPSGGRGAMCHDLQGAAFGLMKRGR